MFLSPDRPTIAMSDPVERRVTMTSETRTAATALIETTPDGLYEASSPSLPREWTYLPGDRPGACLDTMTAGQLELVEALIVTSLGVPGHALVRAAMDTERHRRELVGGRPPAGDRYWIRIHGDPAGAGPWGWQLNGHHIAVHIWVTDRVESVTPHFIGAEPATISHGPAAGTRILGTVEDTARELVQSLGPRQRSLAVYSATPPDDILTRADPVADPEVVPDGVPYTALSPAQREICDRLIRGYLDRAPEWYASACWDDTIGRPDRISFAWAGGSRPGERNYHCLKTATSLLEYDNTQDGGNHAHSVWRHLDHDYGPDPLREHYRSSPGHAPGPERAA
jgi:hypothetical protein